MGTTLNRRAYQRMIEEDLTWLMQQPRTLERDHIEAIVTQSPAREYDSLASLRAERDKLLAERDALREALEGRDTCVVCSGTLLPPSGPPHCENCFVTDTHLDDWEEEKHKQHPG